MKHISFNESEVLSEYARIANEKGIVKAASIVEEPLLSEAGGFVSRGSITGKIIKKLSELQKTLYSSVRDQNSKGEISRLFTSAMIGMQKYQKDMAPVTVSTGGGLPGMAALPTGIKVPDKNVEFITHVADMSKSLKGQLQSVLSADKLMYGFLADKLNILDGMAQGAQLEITIASNFRSPVKNPMLPSAAPAPAAEADDGLPATTAGSEGGKCYDVTGETGEQLIDSAHPGGGTRTELTHSKTDENLVETIVEQQKRDLEVAKSVPKGTYATLVKLHGQLLRLGYGDELSLLRDAILRVSTTKDIVNGTLVGLSDRLDVLGYRKSSSRIDRILLKAEWGDWGAALRGAVEMIIPGGVLSLMGGQLYKRWWGPVAGSLESLLDRLNDLDPRVGASVDIESLKATLSSKAEYFKTMPTSEDPEENKRLAEEKLGQLSQLVPLLTSYQTKIKQASDSGEFSDLWDDVKEAYDSFGAAIQNISAREKQIRSEYPGIAKKLDEAKEAVETKKEEGVASETDPKAEEEAAKKEEEAKKAPGKKTVLNDYGKAMGWAKKFNAVLKKVDPQAPGIDAIHKMNVATGDKVARDAKAVKGPFKKSLLKAVRYARAAGGGWAGLEKKLREDFKDELGKIYGAAGGEAGVELPDDKVAAVEKQRRKLAGEAMAMIAKSMGREVSVIQDEPKIQNIIDNEIRSGSRYFDINDEGGYEKIKATLVKRLRREGFIK